MSKLSESFEALRQTLASYGDPDQAERSARLLKTSARVLGVTADRIHQLAKEFYIDRGRRFSLNRAYPFLKELWNSDIWEEKRLAVHLLNFYRQDYEWTVFDYLSRWLDDVDDATLGDALSKELAFLLKKYPERLASVRKWTTSQNPWRRRAAATTLFLPKSEAGSHLVVGTEEALAIAEQLLNDSNIMVQKGVARLLKFAAKDDPEAVASFSKNHWEDMPKAAKKVLKERK
ncbi:MAG: DNA alkylation repair protein [Calditrichaeota bacterium]|nr:DNA alkylation repair protein [Calditrichota bacterium]